MKKVLLCLACLPAMCGSLGWPQENSKAVYKDPDAPIPDRVHDLLSKMTLEEKVAQLESGWTMPSVAGFKFPSIFEQDHLNEALVKKIAGNGLGTYAFLDEFTGTGGFGRAPGGSAAQEPVPGVGPEEYAPGHSHHVPRRSAAWSGQGRGDVFPGSRRSGKHVGS